MGVIEMNPTSLEGLVNPTELLPEPVLIADPDLSADFDFDIVMGDRPVSTLSPSIVAKDLGWLAMIEAEGNDVDTSFPVTLASGETVKVKQSAVKEVEATDEDGQVLAQIVHIDKKVMIVGGAVISVATLGAITAKLLKKK